MEVTRPANLERSGGKEYGLDTLHRMVGNKLAKLCIASGVRTAASAASIGSAAAATAAANARSRHGAAEPASGHAGGLKAASYTVPRLSIAPMMEVTDKHYRTFARMLTKHTHLYTEMVADNAVIHGRGDLIAFDPAVEEPLTMQLGGYGSTWYTDVHTYPKCCGDFFFKSPILKGI